MTLLKGSNITYISQRNSIELITNYWFKKQSLLPTVLNNHTLFVGDVHSDLHQFIAPLVSTGLITLTGNIKSINNENIYELTLYKSADDKSLMTSLKHFDELTLFVPEYKINTNCKSKIIYLGDMINEWLHSRTILYMLSDLIVNSENVIYIYGNHDINLVALYPLYQRHLLYNNISEHLSTTYLTMSKELNMYRTLSFSNYKLLYNNSIADGQTFLTCYMSQLFEPLHKIFANRIGYVCLFAQIDKTSFMLSHTTINIIHILKTISSKSNIINPNNKLQSVHHCIFERASKHSLNAANKDYIFKLFNTLRNNNDMLIPESLSNYSLTTNCYSDLQIIINDIIHSMTYINLSNVMILYDRSIEFTFLNQIIGHTPGYTWRDANINESSSMLYSERLSKIKSPSVVNNKLIYYFDFNCSAGYDINEISRPDFVYVSNNDIKININKDIFVNEEFNKNKSIIESQSKPIMPTFMLSNFPSFNFIISNDKDGLIICQSKTKHIGEQERLVISNDDNY